MASDNGGEHGVTRTKVTVVTLTYNHDTCLVTIETTGAHLGLAQMMIDEASRQLDTQRRQAAALELQARIEEAKRDAAIAAAVRGRG